MSSKLRESVLDARHRELGCKLDGDKWNNMVMPWEYHTDPYEETAVMRTWAGLFDVSGLYVKHLKGPDAEAVINHVEVVSKIVNCNLLN